MADVKPQRQDTGLVGTIINQADRDRLPAEHPLREVAARMDVALKDYYMSEHTEVGLTQLHKVYSAVKLTYQMYLEQREAQHWGSK